MSVTAKQISGIIRLPFLTLAPVCVAPGAALAWEKTGNIDAATVFLVLLGAVSACISVNALNEYADFKSGLDFQTRRTPFSGGSGTLPEAPALASLALKSGSGSLMLTAAIGLYFLFLHGPALLWTGLPGLIIVAAYSPFILKNSFLTLIAPGLGFGPAMVMGTEFVLSGSYSWGGAFASLIVFFLANNLLLMNQLPDIEPDRRIGRKNIPIAWGPEKAASIIGIFFILAYACLAGGIGTNSLPAPATTGFLTLPLAFIIFYNLRRLHTNIEKLVPFMGLNIAMMVLTPTLVSAGIFIQNI